MKFNRLTMEFYFGECVSAYPKTDYFLVTSILVGGLINRNEIIFVKFGNKN